MVRGNPRVRDMMEIEIIANETRHDIETANVLAAMKQLKLQTICQRKDHTGEPWWD